MSLFLKIFAAIVVLLVLVLSAGALYLFTIFDANDYKTEIQALAKKQTQLELNIDGDLQLSVFPWLGISVENISIDNADEHLASAGYARIFAKFTPLLKGELEVDGIALRDLKLQLVKDAKGQGNWQLESPSTSKAKTSSSSDLAVIPLAAFTLGYLEVENAEISYKDLNTGGHHQLQNLDFRVNNVSSNSIFPVSADFRYLTGELNAPIHVHLTSQISLNLAKQQLALSDTIMDIGNTRIRASLDVQHLLTSPFIGGHINVSEFKPADWANILQTASLTGITLDLDFKSDFQLDTGKGQLALQELVISGPQLSLSGAFNANNLNDSLSYLGKLSINSLNPSALLTALNIEHPTTTDSRVLKSLSGQLQFSGTDNSLKLPKISLKLDDSKLIGNLSVSSFKNMASQFLFNIDSLDLDRYTPASESQQSANQQSGQSSTSGSADALLLPLAALRDLNTNGRLRIGKLIASGLQIDNLDAKVAAYNGFISLKSLTVDLYGGSMNATASIDARNNTPQINFNKRFTGIQAAPLLTSLAEVDYVAGTMDLQINGTAFGNTLPAIKRTLTGEADFNVTDGLLKNTNIEQMVCKSIARIRDRQYAAPDDQPNTTFKEFNGHMNIVKGVMQTDRMLVGLNNMQVNGTGTINLIEESLDYKIRAKIFGDLENQACEVHERYRDVAWPLHCKGSLTEEPSKLCSLDQRELQNIAAQLAQKEIKNKATKELEDKLKDKLGDEAT
ncbi:MAG: AsmA family protein, partial [Pseudomonadales bacterium]